MILLALNGPLEMDMGCYGETIHQPHLSFLLTRGRGWLIAQHTMERGELGRGVGYGVFGILIPKYKLAPPLLFYTALSPSPAQPGLWLGGGILI